ncbi:MAG: class II aldolase/adducin family protein [Methylococcales bacterium]|nr:class II aldolase/adducin family protein [Methylococcales bacterium]
MSHEQEGVIKYQLTHTDKSLPAHYSITELNAWRTLMCRLQLIGQDNQRYDGYGFGNISQRAKTFDKFIISGTQTGEHPLLGRDHYCLVTHANPELNQIHSTGSCKPSSEALTHASVYLQDDAIKGIIHAHCPEIWKNTTQLALPYTESNIAYGTPEMAFAMNHLFEQEKWQATTVFSLLGHEDGVIAFGENLHQAANALIEQFSLALAIEQG